MVAELEHLLPVMRGAPRSDSICLCLLGGPVWARLGPSGPSAPISCNTQWTRQLSCTRVPDGKLIRVSAAENK